jgi:hypothetical protein
MAQGQILFNCLPDYPSHPSAVSRTGSSVWMLGIAVAVRDALSANAGSRQQCTGLWYVYHVCTSKQSSTLSEIWRCCRVTTSTALCCATPDWYGISPCGLPHGATPHGVHNTTRHGRRKLPSRHGLARETPTGQLCHLIIRLQASVSPRLACR